jgi:hypothetical protein
MRHGCAILSRRASLCRWYTDMISPATASSSAMYPHSQRNQAIYGLPRPTASIASITRVLQNSIHTATAPFPPEFSIPGELVAHQYGYPS